MTNTTDDEVEACPECHAAGFERRTSPTAEARFRCRDCTHQFDTPIRRPRHHYQGGVRGGLAQRLLEADPDEVISGD